MAYLSEAGYECLRHAVTLAMDERVKSAASLRHRLFEAGHSRPAIDEAIRVWTDRLVAAKG